MDASVDTPRAWLERRLPTTALGVLSVGLLVILLRYPTYPNYDSIYALLWAREIYDGVTPTFDVFRAPTEHPLAIAFSLLLTPFGEGVDRVMVIGAVVSVAALAAGLYELGRRTFNRWVGLVAGALLVVNWDLMLLAVRGYLDVTYMALVVWGAALEARRRRRGWPVLLLLSLAGLLRPEAWVLCGLYGLWMAWGPGPKDWRAVLTRRGIAWVVAGVLAPAIWVTVDTMVTGQPLFSLTHTSGLAEQLGRTRGILEMPFATLAFFKSLDGTALFVAGVVGVVAAIVILPRRLGMPMVLLVVGVLTFLAIGIAGLSVIDRYLLVPAVVLLIFAAFVVAGWTMVPPGRLRRWWSRLAIVLVLGTAVLGATRANPGSIDNDLRFRGDARHDLVTVLENPAVRRARRCGPVWLPNHKLVPDTRWILDASAQQVLPRSLIRALSDRPGGSPDRRAAHRDAPHDVPLGGVLVVPTSRQAILRYAIVMEGLDDPFDAIALPGYRRIATTTHYAAYARC